MTEVARMAPQSSGQPYPISSPSCEHGEFARFTPRPKIHMAVFIFQRPDSELKVRRFAIASFKLGQENRPFLLRPCFPHDLASVQGLTLARWFLGGSVRQQIGGGKQPRVCDVRVQCED